MQYTFIILIPRLINLISIIIILLKDVIMMNMVEQYILLVRIILLSIQYLRIILHVTGEVQFIGQDNMVN